MDIIWLKLMMVNNNLVGGFFATLLTIIGILLEYILLRMVNISALLYG